VLQCQTPASEGLSSQVAAACLHKLVEVCQYAADSVILPAERLLQREVVLNMGSNLRLERTCAPSLCQLMLAQRVRACRKI
jgi:hypothetical protein